MDPSGTGYGLTSPKGPVPLFKKDLSGFHSLFLYHCGALRHFSKEVVEAGYVHRNKIFPTYPTKRRALSWNSILQWPVLSDLGFDLEKKRSPPAG